MKNALHWFLLCVFAWTVSVQAEVYKWIDEQGKVHYSDQKPHNEEIDVETFLSSTISIDENGLVQGAVDDLAANTGQSLDPDPVQPDAAGNGVAAEIRSLIDSVLEQAGELLPAEQAAASAPPALSKPSPAPSLSPSEVLTNTDLEDMLQKKKEQEKNKTKRSGHQVEIFTTPWCGYCKKAKVFLEMNKIPYKERDISKSRAAALRQKQLGGGNGVPFAVINGQKIKGWNRQRYEQALNL